MAWDHRKFNLLVICSCCGQPAGFCVVGHQDMLITYVYCPRCDGAEGIEPVAS